jgi:hypothetical protein
LVWAALAATATSSAKVGRFGPAAIAVVAGAIRDCGGPGTANDDLHPGQRTDLPAISSGALSCLAHCGQTTGTSREPLGAAGVFGAVDRSIDALAAAGELIADEVELATPQVDGITNAALQPGQLTRLPTASRGALSFLAQVGQATRWDMTEARLLEKEYSDQRSNWLHRWQVKSSKPALPSPRSDFSVCRTPVIKLWTSLE